MRALVLSSLLISVSSVGLACDAETVAKLTTMLKKPFDGMQAQELSDSEKTAPLDVSWKIYTKADGTADTIMHVWAYPDHRISNRMAVLNGKSYAIKNELYNYIEPGTSPTSQDTAQKEIQTYFYCDGVLHLSGEQDQLMISKDGYKNDAGALRDEFLKAVDLKDVIAKTGMGGGL